MSDSSPTGNYQKHNNTRATWVATGICSLVCFIILVILFTFSDKDQKTTTSFQGNDVTVIPDSIQKPNAGTAKPDSPDIGLILEEGMWMHNTDSQGNIVQQYRCSSLNPGPDDLPGWLTMEGLEIEIYLSSRKLMRITSSSGKIYAPNRTMESGTLSGKTRVQLYEIDSSTKEIAKTPYAELHTTTIHFDNFVGEITCPNDLTVHSPSEHLFGRNLTVRFNELEGQIDYLHLVELDYIDFTPTDNTSTTKVTRRSGSSLNNTYKYTTPYNKRTTTPSYQNIHASAIGDDLVYYKATFVENVHIIQGNEQNGRFAKGDELTIAFSNKSKTKTQHSRNNANQFEHAKPLANIFTVPTLIATSTLTTASQDLSKKPVRLTCDGGLTMIPIENPSLIPSTPTDTLIELSSTSGKPAELMDYSQNITASGSRLRYEVVQGRTDMFGEPATLIMDETVTKAEHLWITSKKGIGGAQGSGFMQQTSQQASTTSLAWTNGVDFSFDTSNGKKEALKEVVCFGNVVLTDKEATIGCETLTVSFDPTSDGGSSPSIATATGEVKAESENQTLWADSVEVTFAKSDEESTKKNDSMFTSSQASTMRAIGDIQILLNDGGRAFCDVLNSDIAQETATLTGNVAIAYQRMLIDHGNSTTLGLNKITGKGNWEGAGQAVFLDTPCQVYSDHRISRPTAQTIQNSNNTVSMKATWKNELNITQATKDAPTIIELIGDVLMTSEQTEDEISKMSGNHIYLELVETNNSDNNARELKKVIAKQGAKIEHQTQHPLQPDLPPSFYYIDGDSLELDVLTHDAFVHGEGQLVLRDLQNPSEGSNRTTFAGKGTTSITWKEALSTRRIEGNTYEIKITKDVVMIHRDLEGSISKVQTDTLYIIAIDPEGTTATAFEGAKLATRGMEVQQIKALNNVQVESNSKSVECDTFEYNLQSGIAELSAHKNRSIAITTPDAPTPIRASSILWEMDPSIDRIEIRDLQGTSNN